MLYFRPFSSEDIKSNNYYFPGKSSKAKKRVKHWLDDLEELADEGE